MTEAGANAARRRAQEALASGIAGGEDVRQKGKVSQPITVENQQRKLQSWFVPVMLGDRLAGFIQLATDLTFLRYSGFRKPVEAQSWLAPQAIRTRALELAAPDEEVSATYLSYDQSPDRIAWRVDLRNAEGIQRTVFVVGDFAYESRGPGIGNPGDA